MLRLAQRINPASFFYLRHRSQGLGVCLLIGIAKRETWAFAAKCLLRLLIVPPCPQFAFQDNKTPLSLPKKSPRDTCGGFIHASLGMLAMLLLFLLLLFHQSAAFGGFFFCFHALQTAHVGQKKKTGLKICKPCHWPHSGNLLQLWVTHTSCCSFLGNSQSILPNLQLFL